MNQKILIIDPKISGISGDMLISSLLDLNYNNINKNIDILNNLVNHILNLNYCDSFKIELVNKNTKGIIAKKLNITITNEKLILNPNEMKEVILNISKKLNMSNKALKIIENTINDLIEAEKKIHNDNFHLHEIASLDTIFDIVGTVLLLEKNGYLDDNCKIYTTPPLLGGGHIKIAHGVISIPAPSTLEILCKHKIKYSNNEFSNNMEHSTPTGIALLCNIVKNNSNKNNNKNNKNNNVVNSFPSMIPLKTGYGAGTKETKHIPNVLRVVEGIVEINNGKFTESNMVILETTVDDISGEIIGNLFEVMLLNGAKDIFIVNGIGKKNRPIYIISVITNYSNILKLSKLLMKETGTIGIRIKYIDRLKANRTIEKRTIKINNKDYKYFVKISYFENEIINIKPEYEDVKKIANKTNYSVREIMKLINCDNFKI